jgi:hypothetical protein
VIESALQSAFGQKTAYVNQPGASGSIVKGNVVIGPA